MNIKITSIAIRVKVGPIPMIVRPDDKPYLNIKILATANYYNELDLKKALQKLTFERTLRSGKGFVIKGPHIPEMDNDPQIQGLKKALDEFIDKLESNNLLP